MLVACRLAGLSALEGHYAQGLERGRNARRTRAKAAQGDKRAFIGPLICPRPVLSLLKGLARGSVG